MDSIYFRSPVQQQNTPGSASHSQWLSPASSANDDKAADASCSGAFQTPADNVEPAEVVLADLARLKKVSRKLIEERRGTDAGLLNPHKSSHSEKTSGTNFYSASPNTTLLRNKVDTMMRFGGLESSCFALALLVRREINAIADPTLRTLVMNADSLASDRLKQTRAAASGFSSSTATSRSLQQPENKTSKIALSLHLSFFVDTNPHGSFLAHYRSQLHPWLRNRGFLYQQEEQQSSQEVEEAVADFYDILPACRRLFHLFHPEAKSIPNAWLPGVNLYPKEWQESWDLQEKRRKHLRNAGEVDTSLLMQQHLVHHQRGEQPEREPFATLETDGSGTTTAQAGANKIAEFYGPTSSDEDSSSSLSLAEEQRRNEEVTRIPHQETGPYYAPPSSGKNDDPDYYDATLEQQVDAEVDKFISTTLMWSAALKIRKKINEVTDPKLRLVLMTQDLIGPKSNFYNIAAKGILVEKALNWQLVPEFCQRSRTASAYNWDCYFIAARLRHEAGKWMKTHGYDADLSPSEHEKFLQLLPVARAAADHWTSSTASTSSTENENDEAGSGLGGFSTTSATQQRMQLLIDQHAEQWACSLELEELLAQVLAQDVVGGNSYSSSSLYSLPTELHQQQLRSHDETTGRIMTQQDRNREVGRELLSGEQQKQADTMGSSFCTSERQEQMTPQEDHEGVSDWKNKQREKYKIKRADAFVAQDMAKARRFAQLLKDLDEDVDEAD
ncbi:unnamed protein product [Amoebophrya sp. A120]|nr:unnamed protein product [Amoebophrya sp. A120]|eukprot:GSA120T00006863001.1